VWLISAVNGLVLLVAHPAYGQQDRLMASLWLSVSCAIGWAAALALSWRPGADAAPARDLVVGGGEGGAAKVEGADPLRPLGLPNG
jgi:hypothetical protein